ncbi:MAG: hypothetical protein ACTSR2_00395 [Candidatus Hodarchaeales archaeon]
MVNVYRPAKVFYLKYDANSGTNTCVIDGDVSSEQYLQSGRSVVLITDDTWEKLEVSSVTYDGGSGETTVTFTTTLDNSYQANSALYALASVKIQVGSLNGDDATTSFSVSAQPDEVRKFNAAVPWGIYLQEADPPSGEQWKYNSSTQQVELGFTPTTGDVIVAFAGETWLFDGLFLAPTMSETIEEDIFLEPDIDYDCIYVGFTEYASADVTATWLTLGKEVSPSTWEYYNYHTFCGYSAGTMFRAKVKAELLNPDAEIYNYYNVALYLGHIVMPTN